jgi:hypothetical protein
MLDQANEGGEPLVRCAVRVRRRFSLAERHDLDRHALPSRSGSRVAGLLLVRRHQTTLPQWWYARSMRKGIAHQLALLVVTGCASHADVGAPPTASGNAPAQTPTTERPTIAVLKMRDQSLRVHATGSGPRFSVVLADGRVVSPDLDDRQLELEHQDLWQVYRSGFARGEPYLDARNDH